MARSAAEVGMQECFNQFQREPSADHPSAETKRVHIIVFDALAGGKDIVNKAGTYTGDFADGDGCTDSTTAQRHGTIDPACGDCICQQRPHNCTIIDYSRD